MNSPVIKTNDKFIENVLYKLIYDSIMVRAVVTKVICGVNLCHLRVTIHYIKFQQEYKIVSVFVAI